MFLIRLRLNRFWRLSAGLLVPALLVGCGGQQTCTVRGKVLYADTQQAAKDLAGYAVTFESLEQKVGASGTIRDDGTFEVSTFQPGDGAVPGKHRVAITPVLPTGDEPVPAKKIDPKYESLGTSGLEVTLQRGVNDVVLSVQRLKKP